MDKIDWDLISEFEGKGINTGYVPSENSGVTIGTGVDLKEKNEEYFKKINVSESIIDKVKPFFTLKGAEASEVAGNLQLDDNEVLELDTAVKANYATDIKDKYEEATGKSFTDLNSEQQTVIVSVGFQYGSFERTPSFWKAVVNDDWDAVETELRNFGDNYTTRRLKEADLLAAMKKKLNILKPKTETKYLSPQNAWNQKEQGGELYLDRVYKTYQNWNDARKEATFGEGAVAAISNNQVIPALVRILTGSTFKVDDKWSLSNNQDFAKEMWKAEGIRPEFFDEFTGVVSEQHFMHTLERVKKHQQNKDTLETLGWGGVGLEIGAFILDPVSWTGYGAAAKLLKPAMMATSLSRRQKFVKAGLTYGVTEATVFSPVAIDSPTYGTSDVIIAAALGGTLGGGISTIFAKNLNSIAKAEMLMDVQENAQKLTTKGEKEFKKIKKELNLKPLHETEDIIEDTSIIQDIGVTFGRLRDLPFLGLFPFNRSGALGTSKSELVRLFNFLGHEEPVGYTFKSGAKKGQVAAQEDTVELIKNAVIQGGHNIVYKEVLPALKAYLKEQGHGTIGGFMQLSKKKQFMKDVARVVRSGESSGNKHIDQAAQGYRDGFRYMVDQIKRSGIDGSETLTYFDKYLPRKVSPERFGELENTIGFDGIVQLLRGAIQSKTGQVVTDAASGRQPTSKIKKDKAYRLARWLAKSIQLTNRSGGFDLEQLVKIKDPAKLKEYLDEVFEHLPQEVRDDLLSGLKADDIKLLTSGRLESRIRLDETYETTINGQRVRLDDLYENDVDLLWHSYMNEMSGWVALGERMGIKNRTELVKYKNKLNNSIDESYKDSEAASRYLTKNKYIASEEKKTIDSFFKNVLGRSAEDDPTGILSTSLRQLRKYNFMRVLNQVGIAQLPEFAISTAQQGLGTLIQEMPHFKRLLVKAQKGELDDTFFEDLAVMGSSNGTEYLARGVTNYEIEDMGGTAIGKAHDAARKQKIFQLSNAGEQATGYISGLFLIDSMQRRLTMRLFVNRMAKDLIDVAQGGQKLDKLGSRLNRYRVLGFTDEELLAIGKEFTSKNVTTEVTSLGRRVKHFNFANWTDQNLAHTFARRVNRYTQRAVQYNYLGDTNRFFTDTAMGKSMGQFRSFIMTAWSKQFLHNIAMADMQTFTTFMYTTFIASMAYLGQTQLNTVGMSKSEKKKYLNSKLGDYKQGDYSKIAMASFQRSGWSSLIPSYADIFLGSMSPDNRFNFRTSGLEVNLYTGNPTYDLLVNGFGKTFGSMLKSTRSDYRFSKTDMNRMMRLLPFQNMYGINNIINFLKERSGLPDKGSSSGL